MRDEILTQIARLLAVSAILLGAACSRSELDSASPLPTVCDVPIEAGPCLAAEHAFNTASCRDLAVEWAAVLEGTVLGILGGPELVDGEPRVQRVNRAVRVATGKAIARLDELGLKPGCHMSEFLKWAEPQFSIATRDGIGKVLFEPDFPGGYDMWMEGVILVLQSAYEDTGG